MHALPSSPSKDDPSSVSGQIEQWLRSASGGSQAALGLALEAGRKYLLLLANRALDDKLRAKVGASDLVQEAYLEAQRDFGRFRGQSEGEFYCWLRSILAHRLYNVFRYYRRTKERDINRELPQAAVEEALSKIEDSAHTPATALLAREEQQQVRLALEQMDESMRTVLVERTFDGDSFAKIAARRNCSADAARKMWIRAVRQMRSLLAQKE